VIGLGLQKFFVFRREIFKLARLISTNFAIQGHGFEFEYSSENGNKSCLMVCVCGWKTSIGSFQNPWSVTEVKVKGNDHLKSEGIESSGVFAIFSFEDD
jgi:hypothetical protein